MSPIRRRAAAAATFAAFGLAPLLAAATQPDTAVWDAILAARARNGGFDYRGADGQDRKRLAAYLVNLGDADPKAMGADERKAFYLNAYNATAIAIVLERHPLASIREVHGVFDSIRRKIGREMLTLDDVENRLRGFRDARFHFAIVCAARSSPPLAARAYRAATLANDLDVQGRVFVRDPARNVIDPAAGRLALSQMFEWNRKEFERDAESLASYVSRFTERAVGDWLKTFQKSPEFLPYDWALNQP